jgi:hypothetical protein
MSHDEVMELRVGGASIADNLRAAIEAGSLVENADGTLQLADNGPDPGDWITVHHRPPMDCEFLFGLMFRHAYAKSAVPHGCQACYKVKVLPKTLRELVAAWEIGRQIACTSKWGIDLYNPYSQDTYAGLFYATGLDGARGVCKAARTAFDADPRLGPGLRMIIKRGCSEYEARVGPSDRWDFRSETAAVEERLRTRFRPTGRKRDRASLIVMRWIEFAFRIGDETYLDFTQGRRLRPPSVMYEP